MYGKVSNNIACSYLQFFFFFQAEDGIRDLTVTGVQTCALPIFSNISTTHVVASMVCFRDGVADKNCYRRYRVRTVAGQDDFASMAEVVRRRGSEERRVGKEGRSRWSPYH